MLLALSFFFLVPEIAKSSNAYKHDLIRVAIEQKLSSQNGWQTLLYYKKTFFHGFRSEADNPDFFLSPNGASDPQAELTATIEAIFQSKTMGDNHPQCLFPARFLWLKKQLNIDLSQLPGPDCNNLTDWKNHINAHQATIIFPASYLNNPSSMFGHLFLRFDSPTQNVVLPLMANTLNFAADTSAQNGLIDYIIRGVNGGFPSSNSIQPYYRMLKKYSDMENRDSWSYTLNYSSEEMDFLVLHIWELKDHTFDYYFLDENCAYRIIALLDVVRENPTIADNFHVYTTPVDVVRKLLEHGAVQSSAYTPSAIKTFYYHTHLLNESEKKMVIDIVHNQLALDSDLFTSLSPERRSLVLAISSEYLSLLINKDLLDRELSHELTQRLFAERAKFSPPPLDASRLPVVPPISPVNGHKPHRISIGGGHDDGGPFYSIAYREIGHGLLDPSVGYENGAQVELFNIQLKGNEDNDISLQQLALLNITSLTPMNSFFKPVSWRFSLGANRLHLTDRQPLFYSVESDVGATIDFGASMASGMFHVSAGASSAFEDGYGLGTGLLFNLLRQQGIFSYNIQILSTKYLIGESALRTELNGGISFPLSKNNAVFSQIQYVPHEGDDRYEVFFGFHYYF